jgi:hypothetical protein
VEGDEHRLPSELEFVISEKEYPMSRIFRYGVKFVGYSAEIVALKNGKEIEHATLNFVSGSVSLVAADAFVVVPRRADLSRLWRAYLATPIDCENYYVEAPRTLRSISLEIEL